MIINICTIGVKFDNILYKRIVRTTLTSTRHMHEDTLILKIQFAIFDVYVFSFYSRSIVSTPVFRFV